MTSASDVWLSARAALRVRLVWAMGLFVVAFAGALVVRGVGLIPVVDGWFDLVVNRWLGMLTEWVPAAVCWLAVSRVGFRRWEVPLAAAAVTSYAAGNTYYLLTLAGAESLPFPSPGDVAYLLFYPFMLTALVVALHRRLRGLTSSVWLDSAVGSLGAAAVLAVLLSPVLASALTGPPSLATVMAAAYPMFDMVLVAAVAGIVALGGMRLGRRWLVVVRDPVVLA